MAAAILAEASPNVTSLQVTFSGFRNGFDGVHMMPCAHLYVGYEEDSGVFYLKNGERSMLVLSSSDTIPTFNGSPISSLSDLVAEFKALV